MSRKTFSEQKLELILHFSVAITFEILRLNWQILLPSPKNRLITFGAKIQMHNFSDM